MTKDEQIEEIATIISNYVDGGLHEAECDTLAMMISEAGYRKVSKNYIGTDEVLRSIGYRPTEEVRKETAKEIFHDIFQILAINYVDEEIGCQDECIDTACLYEDLTEIMKKYGVEVE